MKKSLLKRFAVCVALCAPFAADAYDFEADGVYYNIIKNTTGVSVTFKDTKYASYSGDVTIPATVSHDGTTYTVKEIGKYGMRNSSAMTSVSLPEGLEAIQMGAFSKCSGLAKLVIPNSVTTIGNLAIQDMPGLKELVIGSGVETIGTGAFMGDVALESVTLPTGLKALQSNVFANCTSLKSITIPASVATYNGSAFQGCIQLTDYRVDEANESFKAVDGVLMSKDGTTLVAYPAGRTDAEYTVPDGVTTLGFLAFGQRCITVSGHELYNTELKKVNLPASLETLGNSAFQYLRAMEAIELPASLKSIGNATFRGCTALKSIEIPDGCTSIDTYGFQDCTALASATIGSGMTTIGKDAFKGDGALTAVTCKAAVPPVCKSNAAFEAAQAAKATLTVPVGSAAAYKADEGWKAFGTVTEQTFSGIEEIMAGKDAEVTEVYSVLGARRSSLQPGLNIVKMSDGSIRKMVVSH